MPISSKLSLAVLLAVAALLVISAVVRLTLAQEDSKGEGNTLRDICLFEPDLPECQPSTATPTPRPTYCHPLHCARPTATARPTNTPRPPTATPRPQPTLSYCDRYPLDPVCHSPADTPTPPPTATPRPQPTLSYCDRYPLDPVCHSPADTPTPPPTAVPSTSVPPTAVPPTRRPTAAPPTPVPPTAVPPTRIPPTAIPPTRRPVRPTSTPTPTPLPDEDCPNIRTRDDPNVPRSPEINIWFFPSTMERNDCADVTFYATGLRSNSTYRMTIRLTSGLRFGEDCSSSSTFKSWGNLNGQSWYSGDLKVWACSSPGNKEKITARVYRGSLLVAQATDQTTIQSPAPTATPTPRPTRTATPTPTATATPTPTQEAQFGCVNAVPAPTTTIGTLSLELRLPVVMDTGDCGNLTSAMGRLPNYIHHDLVQTVARGSVGFGDDRCDDKNRTRAVYSGNGSYRHVEALHVCDSSYHNFGRIDVELRKSGETLASESIDVLSNIGNPNHDWLERSVSELYGCLATFTESSHPLLKGTSSGRTAEGLAHQGTASIYTFLSLSNFVNSGFGGHAPSNMCAIGVLWLESSGDPDVTMYGELGAVRLNGSRPTTPGVKTCTYLTTDSDRTTRRCIVSFGPVQVSIPDNYKTVSSGGTLSDRLWMTGNFAIRSNSGHTLNLTAAAN